MGGRKTMLSTGSTPLIEPPSKPHLPPPTKMACTNARNTVLLNALSVSAGRSKSRERGQRRRRLVGSNLSQGWCRTNKSVNNMYQTKLLSDKSLLSTPGHCFGLCESVRSDLSGESNSTRYRTQLCLQESSYRPSGLG